MGTSNHNSRDVKAPLSLKLKLKELAYQRRTSASSIVNDIVKRYIAGDLSYRTPRPKATETIRFTTADPEWNSALAMAKAEGVSLSEIIREGIEHETEGISL